ncbi:hypothetical protein [Paenibacillus beijingensis]|uniref:Uncharacterized protein n=1 Tax=Paenibacillus beijingensis TaxID=1126833 RepID=A0A0D5NPE6_9BACL|nr:hypothetical protein [Paenibacillus beijingensis]AJY77121.1 hypothetical protein VN24_24455 [Paenibacillus beijingensis]
MIKRLTAILLALHLALLGAAGAVSAAFAAPPEPLLPVQIFDVAAGKVVKTLDNNEEYQNFAKGWLASVTGLAPQVQPDEKCGYVFRVPLAASQTVKVDQNEFNVQDVFLFYCPDKPPVLLVFDTNRRPYLLSVQTDLAPFLSKVGLSR